MQAGPVLVRSAAVVTATPACTMPSAACTCAELQALGPQAAQPMGTPAPRAEFMLLQMARLQHPADFDYEVCCSANYDAAPKSA